MMKRTSFQKAIFGGFLAACTVYADWVKIDQANLDQVQTEMKNFFQILQQQSEPSLEVSVKKRWTRSLSMGGLPEKSSTENFAKPGLARSFSLSGITQGSTEVDERIKITTLLSKKSTVFNSVTFFGITKPYDIIEKGLFPTIGKTLLPKIEFATLYHSPMIQILSDFEPFSVEGTQKMLGLFLGHKDLSAYIIQFGYTGEKIVDRANLQLNGNGMIHHLIETGAIKPERVLANLVEGSFTRPFDASNKIRFATITFESEGKIASDDTIVTDNLIRTDTENNYVYLFEGDAQSFGHAINALKGKIKIVAIKGLRSPDQQNKFSAAAFLLHLRDQHGLRLKNLGQQLGSPNISEQISKLLRDAFSNYKKSISTPDEKSFAEAEKYLSKLETSKALSWFQELIIDGEKLYGKIASEGSLAQKPKSDWRPGDENSGAVDVQVIVNQDIYLHALAFYTSDYITSQAIKTFSASTWTHIGMIFADRTDPENRDKWWVLESNNTQGNNVHLLKYENSCFVSDAFATKTSIRKVIYEDQTKNLPSSKWKEIMGHHLGKPYAMTGKPLSELASAASLNFYQDMKSLFCSELVAATFAEAGFFPKDSRLASNFLPGYFSTDYSWKSYCPLVDGIKLADSQEFIIDSKALPEEVDESALS